MKHTANTWKKPLGIVAVLVVLVAVAAAAFFRSKPMLDPADSPRISLITADYEFPSLRPTTRTAGRATALPWSRRTFPRT